MKIWMIGDVHGDSQKAMNEFMINPDVKFAIQLGDFGFIWDKGDYKANTFLNKFERRYPNKTIFTVLGNHENYDVINQLPIVEVYGAKAYKIRENVFAILRGEVLTFNGTNILCIGGADSIDKEWRLNLMREENMKHKYWWKEERITQKDIDNALKNIQGKSIDYVCSHEAPNDIVQRLFPEFVQNFDVCSSANMLNTIYRQLDYKYTWFCGHYHVHKQLVTDWQKEKTFDVLDIDEIKEIEV